MAPDSSDLKHFTPPNESFGSLRWRGYDWLESRRFDTGRLTLGHPYSGTRRQ
jgi:hypothetical protein